ncbi:MAG: cobalt-precorrin-4 C(11)-methyltransferase [Peptococcaceae bacterium BICA1-8]|nr:MAG: cobalt-precorrin-4 C(11)-methyltransferase [Peptococcaceae bacterium BICA1-8]
MKVYIIGAGPGDPKLITVKGKEILERADIVIYAGSLVNPDLLLYCKDSVQVYNSAGMTLVEVLEVIETGVQNNLLVVRLHTGDPSIYGAIQEQIDPLINKGIEVEVVPGVSSFVAAAAALRQEFTLPDVSQSLILTRLEGRTPVPEKEKLSLLAAHQTSMCIFLSINMMDKVVEELLSHYPPDTPVAIVQKASWPDEKIVWGTLTTITKKVLEENITKTALIFVGEFLNKNYSLSKLYDPGFSHEYRKGLE